MESGLGSGGRTWFEITLKARMAVRYGTLHFSANSTVRNYC